MNLVAIVMQWYCWKTGRKAAAGGIEAGMGVVKAKIKTLEEAYRLVWTAVASKRPIRAIYNRCFAARFRAGDATFRQDHSFKAYCTGLLWPGERKSIEPMAARLAPDSVRSMRQSLHHLVADAPWDDEVLLERALDTVLPAISSRSRIRPRAANDQLAVGIRDRLQPEMVIGIIPER